MLLLPQLVSPPSPLPSPNAYILAQQSPPATVHILRSLDYLCLSQAYNLQLFEIYSPVPGPSDICSSSERITASSKELSI